MYDLYHYVFATGRNDTFQLVQKLGDFLFQCFSSQLLGDDLVIFVQQYGTRDAVNAV